MSLTDYEMIDMSLSEQDAVVMTGSREIRRLCNAVGVINRAKDWMPRLNIEVDGGGHVAIRMNEVILV